jgi:4-diphosphocytidyl-2-C-methyl-D-erythritol kinase
MQIAAPAKINLNLRVLGKNDATGYHDLETWMVPLTLADELRVELTDTSGIQLTCSDPTLDADSGNLAWRAAHLFLGETNSSGGAKIELHKNIPHGAGLGGGSSDAAAVLAALNRLASHPLSPDHLQHLAAQLGSDVPFFLGSGAALARGRGEVLEPRPLPQPLNLLIIKPPFAIDTAWAYRQWDSDLTVPSRWTAPQLHHGLEIFNDLERPVFAKYLILAALKAWLLEHPLVAAAGLTGSGSSLFAILHDPRSADQLSTDTRTEFGPSFQTIPCNTV